jgi:hypothetical protein
VATRIRDDATTRFVEAVRAQLGDGGVHVPRVEQHQRVEYQAEGPDLVLNAVLVALVELPCSSVEDLPREGGTAPRETPRTPQPAHPSGTRDVGALGFQPGQQVQGLGAHGLLDQRELSQLRSAQRLV